MDWTVKAVLHDLIIIIRKLVLDINSVKAAGNRHIVLVKRKLYVQFTIESHNGTLTLAIWRAERVANNRTCLAIIDVIIDKQNIYMLQKSLFQKYTSYLWQVFMVSML